MPTDGGLEALLDEAFLAYLSVSGAEYKSARIGKSNPTRFLKVLEQHAVEPGGRVGARVRQVGESGHDAGRAVTPVGEPSRARGIGTRLMQEAGYAEYEAHRQDHERLLDEIHDLKFHFEEDPESGKEILTNRLSDWFSQHFRGFDARLHNQLA